MKRRNTTGSRKQSLPEEAAINARYGLEPVFEPGSVPADGTPGATAALAPFAPIQCPYCGEPFEMQLDLSGGSASYIEDCQICCQPIEFRVVVDDDGALESLDLRRGD